MKSTLLQRLTEIERWKRNVFFPGLVVQSGDGQAQVDIGENGTVLVTPWLPLLARDRVSRNEPVLVICPNADPAGGYVIALESDPKIDELQQTTDRLTQQLEQLKQQVSSIV